MLKSRAKIHKSLSKNPQNFHFDIRGQDLPIEDLELEKSSSHIFIHSGYETIILRLLKGANNFLVTLHIKYPLSLSIQENIL